MDGPHQPPVYHGAPAAAAAPAASSRPQRQPSPSSSSSIASTRVTSTTDTVEQQQQQPARTFSRFLERKRTRERAAGATSKDADSVDLEKMASNSSAQGTSGELSQKPRPNRVRGASYLQREVSRTAGADGTSIPPADANADGDMSADSPPFPSCALSLHRTQTEDPRATYIEWEPGDPVNPFNWSTRKKAITCAVCFAFTMTTAVNAVGYTAAQEPVTREFGCSDLTFLLGSTTYLGAVAFMPLVLAPLSETLGRKEIYLAAAGLMTLLYLPQSLAPNIASIIIARGFQGCCASVGNSVVAGSISDIFPGETRGLPMSIFTVLVYVAQAFSPIISASLVLSPVGWRFIFWFQMIINGTVFISMVFILQETRGTVLLSRRACRLTKETGKLHRCRADDERSSFGVMLTTSLTRPFLYLTTEPIVLAFSLWVSLAWGLIFLSLSSVPIAFGQAYGFTEQQSTLVLMGLAVGGLIGWLANFHQEKLYKRVASKSPGGKPPPEARLYYSCLGAVLFPGGLYMYAWGTRAGVNPAVGIVGFVIFNAGVYSIYTAVFSYLADVYERYASSALAAQSWLRNVFAAVFPLFGTIMYNRLGPPIATTILASIGLLLGVVPFILLRYGDRLRSLSRVARQLAREEEEAEEFMKIERERMARKKVRAEKVAQLQVGQVQA